MKTFAQLLILLSVLIVGGCAIKKPGIVLMPQEPKESMSPALKVMTAAGHGNGFLDVAVSQDPSISAVDYSTPINDTLLATGLFSDLYNARGVTNAAMGSIALLSALIPTATEAQRYSKRIFAWIPADQASTPEEAKDFFTKGVLSILESKFGEEPGYRMTHASNHAWYGHTDALVLNTRTGDLIPQNTNPKTLLPMRYLFTVLSTSETDIHPFNGNGKYYLVVGRLVINAVEGEPMDAILKLHSDLAQRAPNWYYQFLYHERKVPMVFHQDKIYLFVKPSKESMGQGSTSSVNS